MHEKLPTRVKWFFLLVVAFTIWSAVLPMLVVMLHHQFHLSGAVVALALVWFFMRGLLYIVPAWLAAFHRANWARWVFASVVGFLYLLPLVAYLSLTKPHRQFAVTMYLSSLLGVGALVAEVLLVTAIFLIFTGSSREWFRQPEEWLEAR